MKTIMNLAWVAEEVPNTSITFAAIFPWILIFGFLFVLVLVCLIIVVLDKKSTTKKRVNIVQKSENQNIDDLVRTIFPEYKNADNLAHELYESYVEIQKLYMNQEEKKLKELCSDELFNSYKSIIDKLKSDNKQIIKYEFKLLGYDIEDIKRNDNTVNITIKITTSYYEKEINTKKKDIDNKESEVYPNYILDFNVIKNYKEMFCPNCGAKIKENNCPYCHTEVINKNKKIILDHETILEIKRR